MTDFFSDETLTYEQVILQLAGNGMLMPDGRLKKASPDQQAMLTRAKEVVRGWADNDHRELNT